MAGAYFLSLVRVIALVGAWTMLPAGAVLSSEAEKAVPTMLLLVEKDNDRTVDLRVGEAVRVTLSENATTGYRWAVDRYDEDVIEALGVEPRYTGDAVGSGGEVTFAFQGRKSGTGEIVLKHWRHWEGDASVIGRFRLRVNVLP